MDQSDLLTLLGGLYDKLVSDVASKVEKRHIEVINEVVGERLNFSLNDIDDQISNWMSNNFDITDYNVDDAIEQWMDNNLDDKVTDAARCLTFTVEVSN